MVDNPIVQDTGIGKDIVKLPPEWSYHIGSCTESRRICGCDFNTGPIYHCICSHKCCCWQITKGTLEDLLKPENKRQTQKHPWIPCVCGCEDALMSDGLSAMEWPADKTLPLETKMEKWPWMASISLATIPASNGIIYVTDGVLCRQPNNDD